MDSGSENKINVSNQEQTKEVLKNTSKDIDEPEEVKESSEQTEQKEFSEKKEEGKQNNLFSSNFQFDKNKIQMNLFNNNSKEKLGKKDTKKLEEDDEENENEQKNKKIDNSKNQEKQETSIFKNTEVKSIFKNSNNFFGKTIPQGSLFSNDNNHKSIFNNNNSDNIFKKNDTEQKNQQSLFSNQGKSESIFNKPSSNLFQQKNTETQLFQQTTNNANDDEEIEKEKDFQGKYQTTKLEKVEQQYPFDIIISQKIEKFKIDDSDDIIEGGVLSLEKSKENQLHFIILRSMNKITLHNSLFLKNFSASKISEKNPILLMIKTFKIKTQDNLNKQVEQTKNIEKDQDTNKDKEQDKTKTESQHHFLKIKFNQPEEAKQFHDALEKVIRKQLIDYMPRAQPTSYKTQQIDFMLQQLDLQQNTIDFDQQIDLDLDDLSLMSLPKLKRQNASAPPDYDFHISIMSQLIIDMTFLVLHYNFLYFNTIFLCFFQVLLFLLFINGFKLEKKQQNTKNLGLQYSYVS